MASSWSCVTCMNVMPTSPWMPLQLELHLLAQLQVERAERLVEEQHARAVDERPRQGDALLLAAARAGAACASRGPSSRRELDGLGHTPAPISRPRPCARAGRTRRCRPRQVREQRVALEDGVDVALVRRQRRHVALRRGTTGPRVGCSKPPIMRSVVVLPQPDGPSMAKNAPRGISSERSSTAVDLAEALRHVLEPHVHRRRPKRRRPSLQPPSHSPHQ